VSGVLFDEIRCVGRGNSFGTRATEGGPFSIFFGGMELVHSMRCFATNNVGFTIVYPRDEFLRQAEGFLFSNQSVRSGSFSRV
jgi:hypothetical protein